MDLWFAVQLKEFVGPVAIYGDVNDILEESMQKMKVRCLARLPWSEHMLFDKLLSHQFGAVQAVLHHTRKTAVHQKQISGIHAASSSMSVTRLDASLSCGGCNLLFDTCAYRHFSCVTGVASARLLCCGLALSVNAIDTVQCMPAAQHKGAASVQNSVKQAVLTVLTMLHLQHTISSYQA